MYFKKAVTFVNILKIEFWNKAENTFINLILLYLWLHDFVNKNLITKKHNVYQK